MAIPDLRLVVSVSALSLVLTAAPVVLDEANLTSRGATARAQSSTISAGTEARSTTRGVRTQGSGAAAATTSGFDRASDVTPAVTGDVAPALGRTPTAAFSNTPTPALGNPTPAVGNPTAAVGGPRDPANGTPSTNADNMPDEGDSSSTASPSTAAERTTSDSAGIARTQSRSTSNPGVDRGGSVDRSNMNSGRAESATANGGDRRPAAETSEPDFVVVTDTATPDSPSTATQFTMICSGRDPEAGCKAPPTFIMDEK